VGRDKRQGTVGGEGVGMWRGAGTVGGEAR
jgi:hypothetical protein